MKLHDTPVQDRCIYSDILYNIYAICKLEHDECIHVDLICILHVYAICKLGHDTWIHGELIRTIQYSSVGGAFP